MCLAMTNIMKCLGFIPKEFLNFPPKEFLYFQSYPLRNLRLPPPSSPKEFQFLKGVHIMNACQLTRCFYLFCFDFLHRHKRPVKIKLHVALILVPCVRTQMNYNLPFLVPPPTQSRRKFVNVCRLLHSGSVAGSNWAGLPPLPKHIARFPANSSLECRYAQ